MHNLEKELLRDKSAFNPMACFSVYYVNGASLIMKQQSDSSDDRLDLTRKKSTHRYYLSDCPSILLKWLPLCKYNHSITSVIKCSLISIQNVIVTFHTNTSCNREMYGWNSKANDAKCCPIRGPLIIKELNCFPL